jgi:hypothetical protein
LIFESNQTGHLPNEPFVSHQVGKKGCRECGASSNDWSDAIGSVQSSDLAAHATPYFLADIAVDQLMSRTVVP